MNQETKQINHNYIKQLYTILLEEYELYKTISEAEKEKNELLMKGIFTDLEPINDKIAELVRKSVSFEQKRITVSNFVSKELEIPHSSSLKKVISYLPKEYVEKFEKIYEKFTNILAEIRRLNEINSRLISDTIRIIDVTLNAFVNENSSVEINYGNQIKGKNKNSYSVNNPKLFKKDI